MCAERTGTNREGNRMANAKPTEGTALSAFELSSELLNARHFAEGEASGGVVGH